MMEWNQGYIDLLREDCRYTEIYGEVTGAIPPICAKLQSMRTRIFKFTDVFRP